MDRRPKDPSSINLRPLRQDVDTDLVTKLLNECADYVVLETGGPPGPETFAEFFEDYPPCATPADKCLSAIVDAEGVAIGLIDIVCRYPAPSDWYIGLFLVVPSRRGSGIGKQALDQVVAAAKAGGATRMLLCVLEDNPGGHAFWTREGFAFRQTTPPWTAGTKIHTRHELMREDL